MLTLLRHPDVLARLRRDPDMVIRTVEEVLHYEPPVHIRTRTTLADINIAGVTIKKGATVVNLLASGSRDPARFPDPDRFDPDRTDNEHFGFGRGIVLAHPSPHGDAYRVKRACPSARQPTSG